MCHGLSLALLDRFFFFLISKRKKSGLATPDYHGLLARGGRTRTCALEIFVTYSARPIGFTVEL